MIRSIKYIFCFLIFHSLVAESQTKVNEVVNGYNIFYYPNGKISSEGILIDGIPTGKWKAFYPDGKIKSIGNWNNNQLDSIWCFYDALGIIKEKISYVNGKKSGYYLTYRPKNELINDTSVYLYMSELFVENKRNGRSEVYFANGKVLSTVYFRDGKKDGFERVYNVDGRLIEVIEYRNGIEIDRDQINRYIDSLKVGTWQSFYDNGSIYIEENYVAGRLNGLRKEYNRDGELVSTYRYDNGILIDSLVEIENEIKLVQDFYNVKNDKGEFIKKASGSYSNGKPIGVHRTYDSLGRVTSSRLYDEKGILLGEGIVNEEGDKVGDWKYYYENGHIKSSGKYDKDRRTGEWKYFYLNEKLEQIGSFRFGLPNGEWNWYYETGELKRTENFNNGKEEGEIIEYDLNGKIVVKGNYTEGLKEGNWFFDYGFQNEQGTFKNDFMEGKWLYFYNNGKKYFEGKFVQGLPDGEQRYYYSNGKIKEIQNYIFGRKEGNWQYFNSDGVIEKIYSYENNQLIRINGDKIDVE